MSRQSIKLKPLGVIKDIPSENVPMDKWSDGINVTFNDEAAIRTAGSASFAGTCVVRPVRIVWIEYEDRDWWLYASGDGVGVYDDTAETHTDITPVGWVPGNDQGLVWTVLNGIPVLNKKDVGAWYWQPNLVPAAMLALPDFTAAVGTANSVRAYKNFLFAIGVDTNPDQVYWSDAAAPGTIPSTWTPLPTNLAGDFSLGETEGPLIDGLPLRNDLIVYKQRGVYLVQNVGGQFVQTQRKLFTSTGVLSHNCVAEWQGRHLVFGDGDIFIHDGVSAQSVSDTQVRRFIFDDLSPDYWRQSFLFHSAAEHEFVLCYPSVGSAGLCDKAAFWNYKDDTWSFRDFPEEVGGGHEGRYAFMTAGDDGTWDVDLGQWDLDGSGWGSTGESPTADRIVFSVAAADKLIGIGLADDNDGAQIDAELTTAAMDFDQPDRIKMIQRIWPELTATGTQNVQFRIGTQFDFGQGVSFSAWKDFDVLSGDKVDFSEQGRLIRIQMRSQGGIPWKLHGFTVEYDIAGRF